MYKKKNDWRKKAYEAELKKIKQKASAKRRARQLGRTKTKAKIVGTLKYDKYGALKKGVKGVGKGTKRIKKGAVKAHKKAKKAAKKYKKSSFRKSGQDWFENVMSGFD